MKQNPELIRRATETLSRWRAKGSSHSQELWDEWVDIAEQASLAPCTGAHASGPAAAAGVSIGHDIAQRNAQPDFG